MSLCLHTLNIHLYKTLRTKVKTVEFAVILIICSEVRMKLVT